MQIVNPQYSFVKFGSVEDAAACCDADQSFCIPVIEETDTYFQIKVTSNVYAEIQSLWYGSDNHFQLLLLSGTGNTPDNFTDNILRNWTLEDGLKFDKYRTGLYEITYVWNKNLKDIKTLIASGGCFQLAFATSNNTITEGEFSDEFSDEFLIDVDTIDYTSAIISNCFKRHYNDCFLTVLEYYNDEDYADFNYCNAVNFVNRVRLPFHLDKPKYIEDKVVYRKSNGQIKQTKSLLTKEYQFFTEHMSELFHDKMAIALAHDNISVIGVRYSGGISKNGEYTPEWTDNICVAPVEIKVLATPFALRNNNCMDCQEVVICDEVGVVDFTLPAGENGVPYSNTATVEGSAPFTLTGITKPSWMTISISGTTITFAGTPTATGADLPVSFTVNNACGTASVNKTIDIEEPTCVPVEIVPYPSLHDGEMGTAYHYVINLTGSAPFDISAVTKPAWMGINLVGSQVILFGTPAAPGDSFPILFTITNACGSADFADEITITEPAEFAVNIIVRNDVPTLVAHNVIQSVTPFFTITLDSYPIHNLNQTEGHHAGYTLPITVNVQGTFDDNSLALIVNGVTEEFINGINVSGDYIFPAYPILSTDNVVIALTT